MDDRLNYAPCGYIAMTMQGRIQEVNLTFLNMTGYEYTELVQNYFETFLSAASKIMFHSLFFPQLRMSGRIEELYLTFRGRNREDIPVLLMGSKNKCGDSEIIDCVIVKMNKRDDYEKELQNIKEELEEAYLSESRLRRLFETTLFSINEGIIVTDSLGNITIMNTLAENYTGWTAQEAVGKRFDEVFRGIDSRTLKEQQDMVGAILAGKGSRDLFDDLMLVSRDGTERYISGTAAVMTARDGKTFGVVSSFRDITKEYLYEKEIDSFLNVNMEMLCVIDENGDYHKINKKFEHILGYKIEELEGKKYMDFVHPEDVPQTLEAIQAIPELDAPSPFTNRYRCEDGDYRYIEWYRQQGAGRYTYSSARDVTEEKRKEEELLKIAVRDELTGLFNRHYLSSYLDYEIKRAEREEWLLTLAILDLDHFKYVNDTWGHPIGDEILKLTAETIGKAIRNTDLLVRFGGEEFVLILPQTDMEQVLQCLERVRSAVENMGHPLVGRQTISIGVAGRLKSEAFIEWYKRADKALYRAKEEGRNRVVAAWEE